MKHFLTAIFTTALLLALSAPCLAQQNPFTAKSSSTPQAKHAQSPVQDAGFWGSLLDTVNRWQVALRREMTSLGRRARQTGDTGPLLTLLGIAFLYGALHAVGPGHGKAVTLAYVATRGRLAQGLIMGSMAALVHGLSGICLVLVTRLLIQGSVRASLASVSHITQVASYAMICLLGAALVFHFLWARRKSRDPESKAKPGRDVPPWAMALAAGLVPCPGVVLVMLFFLSMGMIWLAISTAAAVSLGMALTLNLIGLTAYFSKGLAEKAMSKTPASARKLHDAIELLAALGVMALGALFLAATIRGAGA